MSLDRIREELQNEIDILQRALAALNGTSTKTKKATHNRTPHKRSAASRRKMSIAQKKRWAAIKKRS